MNSMFSCFDALCAELLGLKVSAIPTPWTVNPSSSSSSLQQSVQRSKFPGDGISKEDKIEKAGAHAPGQQPSTRSGPCIAPELDGLNCFETIVLH
ncbi:hypothetical protein CDL15_Pgr018117 [Punica granatum]|uniref:Uncharacterized protein n=1 Tax=Punica granatum TaxID=22663 RepID=A0A218WJL1_PUNGR|nr:hypothetical protein CDL15_Pgr018117 [Punica granatum]PKI64387.1 hypothetical protein CRG98_015247 [Punica granatum]